MARIGSQQIYDPKYLSAVGTLATVKDAEAVPALDAMLALRPDPELTFAVMRALATIGTDEARRTLVRAMDNPSSVVRIYAAGGLLTQ
jgi:HEAT repeat protein